MSSCLPLIASKQYEYKYHFVCPFHVIAPYLFKSYFPGANHNLYSPIDSAFPWLQDVHEENVIVTAEFRDVVSSHRHSWIGTRTSDQPHWREQQADHARVEVVISV